MPKKGIRFFTSKMTPDSIEAAKTILRSGHLTRERVEIERGDGSTHKRFRWCDADSQPVNERHIAPLLARNAAEYIQHEGRPLIRLTLDGTLIAAAAIQQQHLKTKN